MRLIHFSNKDTIILHSVRKQTDRNLSIGKPTGLWVSDESTDCGWYEWCLAEGFNLENLEYAHLITLEPNANILIISNLKQFDAFNKKYGFEEMHSICIHWEIITEEYQGIIISPYLWERRHDRNCFWYYGWNVASGCIWDKNAIQKTELIHFASNEEVEEGLKNSRLIKIE